MKSSIVTYIIRGWDGGEEDLSSFICKNRNILLKFTIFDKNKHWNIKSKSFLQIFRRETNREDFSRIDYLFMVFIVMSKIIHLPV